LFPSESQAPPTPEDHRRAAAVLETLGKANSEDEQVLAYFLRYGYVPLSEGASDPVADAAATIDAAPWIGRQGSSSRGSIIRLIDDRLLEVAPIGPYGSMPTVKLTKKASGSPAIDDWLKSATEAAQADLAERRRYVADLDFPRGQTARSEQTAALSSVPPKAVVKLMAYHGRTWFLPSGGGANFIADFVVDHPDVEVQILVVGDKAGEVVREGASPEQHSESIRTGMASLRDFARTHPNVRIRRYGRRPEGSLLRCQIVQAESKTILSCFVTVWRFGMERAIYGEELSLLPSTNLAMLMNREFDRVFEQATPVSESFRRSVTHYARLYGREAISFGIGPVSLLVVAVLSGQALYLLAAAGIAIAEAWNERRRRPDR
jgi:hypothetical protein